MVNIVILLIILGCAAVMFVKGNIIRASAAIIVAICANMVAFNFFEFVTGMLSFLGSLAQPFSFLLLFALVFALLQTAVVYLTQKQVDFGFLPERIGRVVLGLILGFIVSGVLLTFLAMTPISSKYPYQRFNSTNPDPNNPQKMLLNVDGFVTGLFSNLSSGSFSGNKSFIEQHPNFLDKLYLERIDTTSSSQRTDAQQGRGGRGSTQPGRGGRGDTQAGRGGRGDTQGRGQGRGDMLGERQGRGDMLGERQGRGFDEQRGDMQRGDRGSEIPQDGQMQSNPFENTPDSDEIGN